MMSRSVTVLSDGILKLDAGSMLGPVPKVQWETSISTDRRNRMTLGLNCLLVRIDDKNILIDTGVGPKDMDGRREEYGLVPSRLLKDLRCEGLSAKDIDAVILSRLDFDHCGGCSRLDRSGACVPTFPRATHYIQSECYEEALNPNERCEGMFRHSDFEPLEERDQLELLDGDTVIMPGLEVKVANGPCRGHQIVLINLGGERIAYLGDLVPTPHHLNLASISAYDRYPQETLEMKKEVLGQAERDGWLLVFGHGNGNKAGYWEQRCGQMTFRPVELPGPAQG